SAASPSNGRRSTSSCDRVPVRDIITSMKDARPMLGRKGRDHGMVRSRPWHGNTTLSPNYSKYTPRLGCCQVVCPSAAAARHYDPTTLSLADVTVMVAY